MFDYKGTNENLRWTR